MRSEATSRARAEGIARTRHDVVQRLECKPNVRHAAPARSTNSRSTTGQPPPRKCTPAVICGMFTLLVVQQSYDRRDVGRSSGWKLMADAVRARTPGSKSAEPAIRPTNGATATIARYVGSNEATLPSQQARRHGLSAAGCENDASLLAGKERVEALRRSRHPSGCRGVRA